MTGATFASTRLGLRKAASIAMKKRYGAKIAKPWTPATKVRGKNSVQRIDADCITNGSAMYD